MKRYQYFTFIGLSLLLINLAIAVDLPESAATSAPDAQEKMAVPLIEIFDIGQTVLKVSLQPGVTPEQAIQSMLNKASEINMKIVGQQEVSKEVQARGIKSGRLEILQFCNPEDAIKMVQFNPIYAAYMPCRVALVEDDKGQFWLTMLNLDMLINKIPLPDDLRTIAVSTNGAMLTIITAGSQGDL